MTDTDFDVIENTKVADKVKRPSMYHVIFYNDDFTPMEFVIQVLLELYHKTVPEATDITLSIHTTGSGIAGTYTKEIALQKAEDTKLTAERNEHPLQVSTQVAED